MADAVPLRRRRPRRPRFHYFDRFAGSPLCPRYNAAPLEAYFLKCAFLPAAFRLRAALLFTALLTVVWAAVAQLSPAARPFLYAGGAVLLVCALTFALTFLSVFRRHYRAVGGVWAAFLAASVLGVALLPGVSLVGMEGACVQTVLLLYGLAPVPLGVSAGLGVAVSVAFEMLLLFLGGERRMGVVRAVLQVAVHLVGVFVHVNDQAVRRSTFIRQCECVLTKLMFRSERACTVDTIRALMPAKLAQELMDKVDNQPDSDSDCESESDSDANSDIDLEDRPLREPHGLQVFHEFHGNHMNNVSILYADIIGIWSARKSANETVRLLNDIYTCLDRLCDQIGCEKIATLGDCYHSVAGCPDAVPDHAERCIEFGRAMVAAIGVYGEGLAMRVGVHSGMVVYGIMGTHRFKFDVWSNDVNLARQLKTSGENGRVHVSRDTLECVKGIYKVKDARPLCDIRKTKVLIEYFDLEVRRFRVKQIQEYAELQTFIILDRVDGKEPVTLEEDSESDANNSAYHKLSSETGDRDLIRLVQDLRLERHSKVFQFPPISPLSLCFRDNTLERLFRSSSRAPVLPSALILLLLLLLLSGAALSLPGPVLPFVPMALLALVGAAVTVAAVWRRYRPGCALENVGGVVLLLLPGAAVLSRWDVCGDGYVVSLLLLGALFALGLFPSLSLWTKLSVALLLFVGATPLFFLSPSLCAVSFNATKDNSSSPTLPLPAVQSSLSLLLSVILLVLLARETDIVVRQAFMGTVTARREQRAVHRAKRQASWLLHNLIPQHTVPALRGNPDRCFTHLQLAGVLFADVSNFAYFYDEQYNGGRAMLGVLNALFSDVEALLGQTQFRDVEKIKTVGSCFMAASGLDLRRRDAEDQSWEHVSVLLDFCLAVKKAVSDFNESMFCFDFELKVGVAVGPLTAGVFGSRRLLYDILGDTVNLAYVLCAAGPSPGIRVAKAVAERMADSFVFEEGEELALKEAPKVPTCLLVRRR